MYDEKPKGLPRPHGVKAGVSLIALAILITIGIGLYVGAQQTDVPILILVIPATMVLIGMVFLVSGTLTRFLEIDDEIASLPELLSDDWEAIRSLRLNKAIVMFGLSIALLIGEAYCLLKFEKWLSMWGPINVMLVSVIVAIIAGVLMFKTEWFQWRSERTPWWIFIVAAVGCLLCTGLGTYFAEPVEYGAPTRLEISAAGGQASHYDWSQTRASRIYIFNSTSSGGSGGSSSFSMPECKGKSCGYLYLGILVVILVIICLVGSALIPHFWVLAVFLLFTVAFTIALRELLYVDRARKRKEYDTAFN
jgi:hypothetical protein